MLIAIAPVQAEEVEQQLLRCSVLGDPSARLGCFDALVKQVGQAPAATAQAPPPATPAAPAQASVPEAKHVEPASELSRMTQVWELSESAKRGRYAFRPYRDNYLLIANYSNATNDQPFRAFTPGGIGTKHVELTYQLSFKVKMLEGIADTPIDLWAAYTQQSFWQAYYRAASSPFRETNYQPEVMAVLPLNKTVAGFALRYAALGFVHQSNGQSRTLSRSWNRLYGELGAESGNFGLTARIWKRLDNAQSENDNPDIVDFMGHGDLRATYRNKGHEYSMLVRRNFDTHKGAIQAGWAFPLRVNLKGYLQVFSGYGQSLIDYNYSQKSIGAGVLMDF
jgi:phospholipase A1